MTRRSNRVLGMALLALVATGIGFLLCPACFGAPPVPTPTPRPAATASPSPIPTTKLYVCGGYRYFKDPAIQSILSDQYHLEVTGEFKKGTFAMAEDCVPPKKQVDCIFPGSQIGIEYYKERNPGVILKSTTAAQDRIILFTWVSLLPELQAAGLVDSENDVWHIRMKPLTDALIAGKQWKEIGVDIPGYARVEFTDPVASSSGVQWMAFVGSYLVPGNAAGGKMLTMQDLEANPQILTDLRSYWEQQGAQRSTTAELFAAFIASGSGMPMIVGYESSFTDWYTSLPADQQTQAAQVVGLYPDYAVGVEHVLASVSAQCNGLLDAITSDAQIQQLAWEGHGLHPQGMILTSPPASAPWLALNTDLVPEPKKSVTDAILAAIQE